MLKLLLISILALGFFQYVIADDSGVSLEKARTTLSTTNPNRYWIWAASSIRSTENLKRESIYNQQWAAILRLSQNSQEINSDDIKLLIPYLGYGLNGAGLIKPFRQYSEEDIKKSFPAFAVIVENASASKTLSAYCLDSKNESRYRITAFLLLRYIDAQAFKAITPAINDAFSGADPNIREYLSGIEGGQVGFWGDVPIE